MTRVCQRLKTVIVTPVIYPRFLKFLHIDTQSTGRTLSRPWSRQPNDVMSEIDCAQLHSELLRRRHSTWQSHGLLALAKHLFSICHRLDSQPKMTLLDYCIGIFTGWMPLLATANSVNAINELPLLHVGLLLYAHV